MRQARCGFLVVASAAVLLAGCGGSSKSKPASASHKSAEGAMAGLIAAMKSGDNAQVSSWLSPTPPNDRASLTTTERLHKAVGLGGSLFWEASKLTVKSSTKSGTQGTVTLSGPIVWCLGNGATDAKASCAQPDGAQGQSPVYKAVNVGGQWYIDFDINKGRNLPGNPAASGASPTTPTPAPSAGGDPQAKSKLQAEGTKFNTGQARFLKQVTADSKARNIAAVKADVSQFRDVIFNFDAAVRKIKFPPAKQTDVNAMLEGDRTTIAELDAMGATTGFPDFAPLFTRFLRDKRKAVAAINRVIGGL
jgi:hypothetical protein